MVYEDRTYKLQCKLQQKASHTYIKHVKVFICVTSVAQANTIVRAFSSLTSLPHMCISLFWTISG